MISIKQVRLLVFLVVVAVFATGCLGGIFSFFTDDEADVSERVDAFLQSVNDEDEDEIVSYFQDPFVVDYHLFSKMEFEGLESDVYEGLDVALDEISGYLVDSIGTWTQGDVDYLLELSNEELAEELEFPELLIPVVRDILQAYDDNGLEIDSDTEAMIEELVDMLLTYYLLSEISAELNEDEYEPDIEQVEVWLEYCGLEEQGIALPKEAGGLLFAESAEVEWGDITLTEEADMWLAEVECSYEVEDAMETDVFTLGLEKVGNKWLITYLLMNPFEMIPE